VIYDVAIVGLGAMGSSSVFELSRRGQRVVGFDAFAPPHSRASSHGETRVIREAYFEDPIYVPLVQRAYELWHDLELRSGRILLNETGGLMLGLPDSSVVRGASASATTHHLAHEVLSAAEIRRRYPAFRLPDSIVGVLEPRAGVLFPERCIDSYLTLAVSQGATLVVDEPVLEWEVRGDSVWLRTANQRYNAGRVVFCCGPWITTLVNLPIPLQVERNVLHWYQPQARSSLFQLGALPIFLLEDDAGRVCYGLPELPEVGAGVKVARHHLGETTTADGVNRTVSEREIAEMTSWVDEYLPDLANGWRRAAVCLYTNTPDTHFLIDRHPELEQVWIVSPCSGHGFKFASVIGELVADLIIEGRTDFDIRRFQLNRGRN